MNPVAFSFGNFEIRWYTIFILLAVILAYILVNSETKRLTIKKDFVFNAVFWTIIMGIIGARLYYVLFNFSLYQNDLASMFKVWEGGLAIHGGIIFGLITLLIYCKKYNVRLVRITDIFVIPLILGQAIGRWGNFFNGEAHGAATTIETLKDWLIPDFVIKGMNINGILYFPTFYVESIVCLAAFIFLIILRRSKYVKVGTITAFYMIIYGVLRFFIEISRTDALMIGGFKVAQIVSIIMFIVGLGMLMINSRKGKFEDLYNDTTNSTNITF